MMGVREFVCENSIINQWDFKKNDELGLDPRKITCGSAKKVWWVCENGHSTFSPISDRSGGHGCSYCSGRYCDESKSVFNLNKELMKEWHQDNKFDPKKVSLGSDKKIKWICERGHTWEARIPDRLKKGSGCPACKGCCATEEKNLLKLYPEIVKEWDYKNNSKSPDCYLPQSNYIANWICDIKGHIWAAAICDRVRRKTRCPFCSNRVSKIALSWLDSIGIINKEFKISIKGRKYEVDGFDPKTNTVYEFYGDFWHGNPNIFNQSDFNSINNKTYGELYHLTILRENMIIDEGFNLITMWESDYLKIKSHYEIYGRANGFFKCQQ